MRHDIPQPQLLRKPPVAVSPAGPQAPTGRRVRFPCGHMDSEALLAGRLRERKHALWVRCPECNVIAVVVAIIEPR
jgi:hypothetical protein